MHCQQDGAKNRVSSRNRLWYLGIVTMKILGPSAIRRLLNIWAPFGKNIVVMGLKLNSVEMAHFLAKKGKKVTVVDTGDKFPNRNSAVYNGDREAAERPMAHVRTFCIDELAEMGAQFLLGVKYEEITDKGLVITNKEGKRQTLEADTIVCEADYIPNTELSQKLAGLSAELHLVGDCVEPVGMSEAINNGARIGRTI